MTLPTARAQNVWESQGGNDFLQLQSQTGSVLGGINSSGVAFGNLAGVVNNSGFNVVSGASVTPNPISTTGTHTLTQPALSLTGPMLSAGTPLPYVFIGPGSGSPTWNASGTVLGINAPNTSANLIDIHKSTAGSIWRLDSNGGINASYILNGATGIFTSYGLFATAGNGVPGIYNSTAVSAATTTQSGLLRVGGNIAPVGVYRVHTYALVTTPNSAGNLNVSVGWNDGTAARTATNGTNGQPTDISTAATNFAEGSTIVRANGINDITYAFTVTQTTGTATFACFVTLERL